MFTLQVFLFKRKIFSLYERNDKRFACYTVCDILMKSRSCNSADNYEFRLPRIRKHFVFINVHRLCSRKKWLRRSFAIIMYDRRSQWRHFAKCENARRINKSWATEFRFPIYLQRKFKINASKQWHSSQSESLLQKFNYSVFINFYSHVNHEILVW